MKSNNTYLVLISICLCLITVAGVLYLNIHIDKKIQNIKEYVIIQEENTNIEFGNNLTYQTQTLLAYKDTLLGTFLKEEELVTFVETLETIAQELNIELILEKVDREKAQSISDTYKTQDVRFMLNMNGQYSDIKEFLERISEFKNEILVEEFKLYRNKKEDQITYNARVTMITKVIQYDKK